MQSVRAIKCIYSEQIQIIRNRMQCCRQQKTSKLKRCANTLIDMNLIYFSRSYNGSVFQSKAFALHFQSLENMRKNAGRKKAQFYAHRCKRLSTSHAMPYTKIAERKCESERIKTDFFPLLEAHRKCTAEKKSIKLGCHRYL